MRFFRTLKKRDLSKCVLLRMIFGYKRWISPAMGARCRFYPSCSSYAAEAIERFGSVKGLWFTARRILRCNQFTRGGIDEVPRKK